MGWGNPYVIEVTRPKFRSTRITSHHAIDKVSETHEIIPYQDIRMQRLAKALTPCSQNVLGSYTSDSQVHT